VPLDVGNDFLEAAWRGKVSAWAGGRKAAQGRDARKLVVNVVAKAGRVDDVEGDSDTILLELCMDIRPSAQYS
jgi:hypothetical protein